MAVVVVGKGITKQFTINKALKFGAAFRAKILSYGVIKIGNARVVVSAKSKLSKINSDLSILERNLIVRLDGIAFNITGVHRWCNIT